MHFDGLAIGVSAVCLSLSLFLSFCLSFIFFHSLSLSLSPSNESVFPRSREACQRRFVGLQLTFEMEYLPVEVVKQLGQLG